MVSITIQMFDKLILLIKSFLRDSCLVNVCGSFSLGWMTVITILKEIAERWKEATKFDKNNEEVQPIKELSKSKKHHQTDEAFFLCFLSPRFSQRHHELFQIRLKSC